MSWKQRSVGSPDLPSPTLGEVIAGYRRSRRQSHRDAPWSQEELAFASGTDQAHISRIESNRQVPAYSTLVRICDALTLSPAERSGLLALAGYRVVAAVPDEAAVNATLARIAPLMDGYPYPAVLLDECERMWYVNAVAAAVWGPCYGATDQPGCLARVRGRRVVDLIFDPEPGAARLPLWRTYYHDADGVLDRILTILWRAWSVRPDDPELNRDLAYLDRNPEFRERWRRAERVGAQHVLVDYYEYVITPPELGALRFHCWRTRVAQDERFIVVHFTPIDTATSQRLAGLAEIGAPRRPDHPWHLVRRSS